MSTESSIQKTPPPHYRQVRMEEVDGDLELTYRKRPWFTGCFLLVWLTGWTGGCVALVGQAIRDPGFFNLLACAPFLASWCFVTGLLVWMLFGVERVRLSAEGLEHRRTALVLSSRRWIPRAELKGVRAAIKMKGLTEESKEGEPARCVTFDTLGQPVEFACGIEQEEQRWLVEWLTEYLDALAPHGVPLTGGLGRGGIVRTEHGEILRSAASPVGTLSETRIELRQDPQEIEFVWRGEWRATAIAGITFVNLFWNGIIGLFLCKQMEEMNWFLCFFVLHGILGLFFFVCWLMTLTAPAWRLRWTFREREARKRLSVSDENAAVCDLGWSKRFKLRPPLRIALQRKEQKQGEKGSLWGLLSHPDGDYTLSLLGDDAKQLLRINHLNEGDARWMADVLLRAFPSWSLDSRGIFSEVEGREQASPDGTMS